LGLHGGNGTAGIQIKHISVYIASSSIAIEDKNKSKNILQF
jgi:hypothetical protein